MISTVHQVYKQDARCLSKIEENSVNLVVTSPPYPMIQMWDDLFSHLSAEAAQALEEANGAAAFEAMHKELDKCWQQISRLVKPGGVVCVNIGDATRTIGSVFSLYPNHSRIISTFLGLGFCSLPAILWRKPTNAPNKFMGSGMLPGGAYVTLEHEYILVFRKGDKRVFTKPEDKKLRRESAYFWEERNVWFSDIWQLIGARQALKGKAERKRSAAFPFELAYRLINMYSVKGDLVLDPFLGTGTTCQAAAAACRNSAGFEIDEGLISSILNEFPADIEYFNTVISSRLEKHRDFLKAYAEKGKQCKHHNACYDFPVVTAQEKELSLDLVSSIEIDPPGLQVRVKY